MYRKTKNKVIEKQNENASYSSRSSKSDFESYSHHSSSWLVKLV